MLSWWTTHHTVWRFCSCLTLGVCTHLMWIKKLYHEIVTAFCKTNKNSQNIKLLAIVITDCMCFKWHFNNVMMLFSLTSNYSHTLRGQSDGFTTWGVRHLHNLRTCMMRYLPNLTYFYLFMHKGKPQLKNFECGPLNYITSKINFLCNAVNKKSMTFKLSSGLK